MKRRICIIHFQPLEKYPPVINFLRYLAAEKTGAIEIHVISTGILEKKKLVEVEGIFIHRIAQWKAKMAKWQRILLYIQFIISGVRLLWNKKPQKVLYYETLSAAAPYVYKKWINRSSELYIHYHEYTSPAEYKSEMLLTRWLHNLEKKIYKKAQWVSHTNEDRLQLFLQDVGDNKPPHVYTLPNYPPGNWQEIADNTKTNHDKRLGFVYIGALSLETTYIKEFADFIAQKPDDWYWDIYSDNLSPDTLVYFQELKAGNIKFKGGVEYDVLPKILPQYNVGVVFYKGHIPNYVYNAPNKLFEYLACGLDVWFTHTMKTCFPYITSRTYPKVLPVNFNDLHSFKIENAVDKNEYQFKRTEYYCENIFYPLTRQLLKYV